VCKEERRRRRERPVVNRSGYKGEIINTAEYLHTNYKEEQFVNIVKSYENTQPNSTVKTAAKVTEELSQSNNYRDTKQRTKTCKGKIERDLKEKLENQSNTWRVY
jgi:hypothetical protein